MVDLQPVTQLNTKSRSRARLTYSLGYALIAAVIVGQCTWGFWQQSQYAQMVSQSGSLQQETKQLAKQRQELTVVVAQQAAELGRNAQSATEFVPIASSNVIQTERATVLAFNP